MAKNYTANFKEKVSSTSGEAPVYLLTIEHPQLATPIRVVNDNSDFTSNGNTFTAMAFQISLPDDVADQLPRAKIAIDNIGRELTQWLDASNGGQGATVTVQQVMRNTPNIVEAEYVLDLINVKQDAFQVTGELGYEDTLNAPGLTVYYRPENTPGIF
jgi:hypothetical protein